MKATRQCSVVDCERPVTARGWCTVHYQRWRTDGDVHANILVLVRPVPDFCQVDGCDGPGNSRGYCPKHYKRWRKHGDPLVEKRRGCDPGPANPLWAHDQMTYGGAHVRVRRIKGPASAHLCVGCGRAATAWAYDHRDPNEMMGFTKHGKTLTYSMDASRYMSLCGRCHWFFDHPRPAVDLGLAQ